MSKFTQIIVLFSILSSVIILGITDVFYPRHVGLSLIPLVFPLGIHNLWGTYTALRSGVFIGRGA
jgi:hypothetical protein